MHLLTGGGGSPDTDEEGHLFLGPLSGGGPPPATCRVRRRWAGRSNRDPSRHPRPMRSCRAVTMRWCFWFSRAISSSQWATVLVIALGRSQVADALQLGQALLVHLLQGVEPVFPGLCLCPCHRPCRRLPRWSYLWPCLWPCRPCLCPRQLCLWPLRPCLWPCLCPCQPCPWLRRPFLWPCLRRVAPLIGLVSSRISPVLGLIHSDCARIGLVHFALVGRFGRQRPRQAQCQQAGPLPMCSNATSSYVSPYPCGRNGERPNIGRGCARPWGRSFGSLDLSLANSLGWINSLAGKPWAGPPSGRRRAITDYLCGIRRQGSAWPLRLMPAASLHRQVLHR